MLIVTDFSASPQFGGKYAILDKLQPLLSRPQFSYVNYKAERESVHYMLELWEFLLNYLDLVRPLYLMLC